MTAETPQAVPVPVAALPTSAGEPLIATRAPIRSDRQLHKQMRFSIAISAARCLLTYVVVPILSPLIEPAIGHSPGIAIPLSVTALYFDGRAIRNVWRSDHRWRLTIIAMYGLLMAGIIGLLAHDIWALTQ